MDDVFRALADPTRRSLLDELFQEDGQTLSALEARLPMTRFGVMKHLRVLEHAGLIARGRDAQWRPCRLQPAPLKDVAAWLEQYRAIWEGRLDRLDTYLQKLQATHKAKEKAHGRKQRRK